MTDRLSHGQRGRPRDLLSRGGRADAPKLLLLHGFPTASHMFRDLIPLLADRFHIVAPDLPGFGQSDMPRARLAYTFAHIADVIDRFTEVVGFDRYRRSTSSTMARRPAFGSRSKHPERITAIISQNGNAYEEGLSEGWNPIRAYWQDAIAGQPCGAAGVPHARDDASGSIRRA